MRVYHRPKFCTWLKRQADRDDEVGDLATDFREDRTARGIRTARQLSFHLFTKGACPEARAALAAAIREFRREYPSARLHSRRSSALRILQGGAA